MKNKDGRLHHAADPVRNSGSTRQTNSGPALRKRAMEIARRKAAESPSESAVRSQHEERQLIHELQVHQIELEIQNEELRRAQAERDAAQTRYLEHYDFAPVGYCTLSEKGVILEANLTMAKLLDVARNVLVGRSLATFILTEDLNTYDAHRVRRFESGELQPCELRLRRSDGTVLWVRLEATAAVAADGAPASRVIFHNLTEQKRAEVALREIHRRHRAILQTAMDGFWLVEPQGRLLEVNDTYCQMSGYSAEELLAMRISDLEANETAADTAAHLARIMRHGEDRFESRHRRKDGSTFDVEISVKHEQWPAEGGWLVVFLREITTRKQQHEELRKSREMLRALAARLQAVREEERISLARELHDELGQGLTALQIDLTWLDSQLQSAGQVGSSALQDRIVALVPQVERLIETTQMISSSLRPGVLDKLGLVAAIEWLAEDFSKRTRLACEVMLPDEDIALDTGRAVALFRILQEAQTNVIRHAKASRVAVRLRAMPDELLLEVQDDGRGITPQQIANPNSLGLLSMRERAAVFGATVDFFSEPLRGTTVRVRLPLA